jgi:hypothetical protein
MIGSGNAHASSYVREAQMHSNLKGISSMYIPVQDPDDPYVNSVSYGFVPESVLLNFDKEIAQRIQLRKTLVENYIPANP